VPTFYRERDIRYVPATESTPYVVKVGVNPLTTVSPYEPVQTFASERRLPMRKQTTTLQGVDFVWQVDTHASCPSGLVCFDVYGNPTRVTKASIGGAGGDFSRTEVTTYANDTTAWVIGQPAILTDVATGKIVNQTDYNAAMLPWKTYSFGVLQQTLTYDTDGTLLTVKDGGNNTLTLGGWKAGTPQTIAFPGDFAQSAVVNNVGWITSVTDDRGSGGTTVTGYGYDAIGRLNLVDYTNVDTVLWNDTSRNFVPVASAEYGIPAGHWKQTVQTGNGRTTTYYDARWQPVLTRTEDTGNSATVSFVVTRFDVLGRKVFSSYPVATLTAVTDATLKGITTSYDALGRAVKAEQYAGPSSTLTTTTDYLAGFLTRVTNPRGAVTETSYQVFDSPNTDAPVQIIAAKAQSEQQVTVIARQPSLGKTVSLTRSGTFGGSAVSLTRSYGYDANERLCETIDPEVGATIVDYDPAGNILWSTDGSTSSGLTATACTNDRAAIAGGSNNRTIRTYDAMNRVLTMVTPDGIDNTTATYELDGKLKTLVGGGGTWSYGYNKRRLLETESLTFYGPYPITHAYDANGFESVVTSPNGTAVNYAPNAIGQATQAGSYASGVSYYPNGAIKQFTYGNGVIHKMDQDARQLPMRSHDYGTTINHLDDNYGFDENGNVTTIVDNDGNSRVTTRGMLYDKLDRLTSASGIWGSAFYTYDPLDNLRTNTLGASGLTYVYDASNRLQRLDRSGGGSYNYTYDPRGNVINDGRNAYTFTRGNRLASIAGKDSYQYDGHGRRLVVWRADSTAQVPVYGQDGKLRYIADNRPGTGTSLIYLGGSEIAESVRNWATNVVTVKYVHTDALGSPVAKSDAAGVSLPAEAIEYSPYGAPVNRPVDEAGYTGHVMDQSSGLIYMQQRYYDPQVGRFLSLDSVSANANTGANFNRFKYAANSPYKFTDPDGRQDAADRFGDRFKQDAESGNSAVYAPFRGPVVVATGLMLVGPAAFALLPEAGVVAAAGSAAPTATGSLIAASEAAGGHMIARHVGVSAAQLATRLATDGGIRAASSFTSAATAEASLDTALVANQGAIASWLSGTGGARLAIQGVASTPVGAVLARGAAAASETPVGRFILERSSAIADGFRIVTGYPVP
jgi:RHS repeat-associated protein